MNRRLAIAVALGALCGCDRATPPSTPPASEPAQPSSSETATPAFVEGRGLGASEPEAYDAALDDLAKTVLGDPAWLDVADLRLHDPSADPYDAAAQPDGSFAVTVGLSRARVVEVISALEVATPRIASPPPWRDTVYAFLAAHFAAHVCDRRRVLFQTTCERGETADADAALAGLAKAVTVSAGLDGGVPLDARGHALRPPTVRVLWGGMTVAGIPVTATGPEGLIGSPTGLTDVRGVARIAVRDGARWSGPVRVRVDATALLGPLRDAWPSAEVILRGRPTSMQRHALVVEPGKGRSDRSGAALAEGLGRSLRAQGLPQAVALPRRIVDRVAKAGPTQRRTQLATAADEVAGRVDVVLVAWADSRFAGRVDKSRVWFEAKGTLVAHDIWSGDEIARVEHSVTAQGVGDQRADAAARRALSEALVKKLLSKPAVAALRSRGGARGVTRRAGG